MAHLEWDIGVVRRSEYDADGFLGIAYDAYGEQKAGIHPGEVHWPFGTFGRPRDPDTDGKGNAKLGANVLWAWEGNTGHALPLSDPRSVPKLPRLKDGGWGHYCDTGNSQIPFDVYDGDTGSRTLYVPYAFAGGVPTKAMSIQINVDSAGHEAVSIIHGDGMAVTMVGGQLTMRNATGDCYIQLSSSGGVLAGNWTVTGAMVVGVAAPGAASLAQPALTTALTPSAFLKVI